MPFVSAGRKLLYWSLTAFIAVLVTGGKLLLSPGGNVISMFVVAPMTGFCAGILLVSLVLRK